MAEQQKEYVCKCGRVFNNSQAFNGHRSHCKEHLGEEKHQDSVNRLISAQRKAAETRHQQSIQLHNDEIQKWISEKHKCEKCGKIMTEKFGTGRFCSAACANSRIHSDETRLKTAKSLKNFYTNLTEKDSRVYLDFDNYIDGTKELYLSGVINHRILPYYLLDKIEGVDFVICPYCGIRLSHIQYSHLKSHNKTPRRFKK